MEKISTPQPEQGPIEAPTSMEDLSEMPSFEEHMAFMNAQKNTPHAPGENGPYYSIDDLLAKEGDEGVMPSDLVNPGSEVSEEQNTSMNIDNQGYINGERNTDTTGNYGQIEVKNDSGLTSDEDEEASVARGDF